jgi:MoaA/NifB/PqqE/SkfB family radical SAM enzyme
MHKTNLYSRLKPLVAGSSLLKKLAFFAATRMPALYTPKILTIAATYRCQCRCFHCGVSDYLQPQSNELSTDEIRTLIAQARDIHSIVQVTFTGGEALLRQDIFELISFSKQADFYTKIDSHGGMLDKTMLGKLKNAGLDRIDISIDHFLPDEHDRLRRMAGLFDTVRQAVGLCRDLAIDCYLQTYVTHQNLGDGTLEKVLQRAQEWKAARIKIQPPALLGKWRTNDKACLEKEDYRLLDRLLARYPAAYFESEFFSARDYPHICKIGLKGNIYVTAYGQVLPCCYLPLAFGNIRERPLIDVLRHMYGRNGISKARPYQGCLCGNRDFFAGLIHEASFLPIKMYNEQT